MNKIVLAFVLIVINTAAAAEFSGQNSKEADILVKRSVPATQITITPVNGLTSNIDIDTILAYVKANTLVESSIQLGLRWTSGLGNHQIISPDGFVAVISQSQNPEYKLYMRLAELPGKPLKIEIDDNDEFYFVAGNTGVVEANIIMLAALPSVEAGTYKVSMDSAIYNP
uniref:Uncharacterized protein n=1 Tax=Enterobacter cloacae TaxID=550 RepID=A0A1S6XY44_ENTCL|nr:hypothetical protein [Enterobacter cloacae]AQX35355.1 hypothetical protein PIMI5_00038 [Enterobacter cloacae]